MSKHEVTIKVKAATPSEAARAAKAAMNLYYASMEVVSLEQFENFSNNIKDNPKPIGSLKTFKPNLFK